VVVSLGTRCSSQSDIPLLLAFELMTCPQALEERLVLSGFHRNLRQSTYRTAAPPAPEHFGRQLAFVLISKLYRQMYANTGIATDSAIGEGSTRLVIVRLADRIRCRRGTGSPNCHEGRTDRGLPAARLNGLSANRLRECVPTIVPASSQNQASRANTSQVARSRK
jgi:hypothetical protein